SACMQKILTHSAQGDDEMPGFPELSFGELLHPAFLVIGTSIACFAPAFLFAIFSSCDLVMKGLLSIAFGLFGCIYYPMALTGVSIYQSIFALNPLLIIPSMIKIPLAYLVVCIVFTVLIAVSAGAQFVLAFIPFAGVVIAKFVSLYFLSV